ncbi:MAG: hypothetical protein P4L43_01505 [Syntrophobacteraceae bacterium]|nr:hypothetical protein [Syntrophobacteraceae bacterium]
MTDIGDVVLVYMDNNPAFFAKVDEISADVKPGWFQVKLLVLQVPLLVVTWILRQAYFNGEEFTMGGRPMRIEKVVAPVEVPDESESGEEGKISARPELVAPKKQKAVKPGKPGNVISISDRFKKERE